MAPELLVNEGTAWTTYLNGQRKMVDYSKLLFDDMIGRIKEDMRPELVLITGDLTKDGEKVSHEYVTSKLDELRAIGIKTLVIPGNHDRGSNSDAVYYDGESTTAATVATNEWFATQYANYGYGVSSEREGTTLTYACEPITGLVVIGIDSGTDGNVSETTLDWVVEKATAARASGKKVIAMMHHPLMPHFAGVDNFVSTAVVGNYETVRNTLADAGIRVVFTGHFHTSDIAKDWNADKSREIYDVNTGSLISYPCDYREVTMSADFTDMAITTGHSTAIASETAKERLNTAVKNQIAAKGTAYSLIAPTAAQAFVIHAEGNETENASAATILSTLVSAAEMGKAFIGEAKAQELKDMASSMLEDKSQYGTERENVTNDLMLSIELPEAIKLAADGYSTYCSENRLDISKTTGVTAYIVNNVTETTVELQEVSVIPAETGFILKGTGNAWYDLYKTSNAVDDVTGNQLHGTLTETAAPANSFALSTKKGVTGFYPVSTGLMIPAHKAYLTATGSMARSLSIDGEVTGILNVDSYVNAIPAEYYSIHGIKVVRPTKGIYIRNGKKVVIK
jgi:3',5'-cyclic AMP phosphodiesterase CpdA